MSKFPFFKQLDSKDCGPVCLKTVAEYYGRKCSLSKLRDLCHLTRKGVNMLAISNAAESLGFRTLAVQVSVETIIKEQPMPFIAYWNQEHFVVVYKIKRNKVYVSDPAHGLLSYSIDDFKKSWYNSKQIDKELGIALLLEPTPALYESEGDMMDHSSFSYLLKYLKPHKKFIVQLLLGLLLGSILQLIIPLLTQSIVDIGIGTKNVRFIYLVMIAQLIIVIARMILLLSKNCLKMAR